ncbi:MAG TPA: T9SS type A sorting domain-containing protein [bacterium]|nr:T9SS type A sorting domain-containing protein [bacterium]HPN45467.1 T9SS type A sorting domain-containing protein [bacterium]
MKNLLFITLIVGVLAGQVFSYTYQGHYRWRNDDGSEATATWKANENTTTTAIKNTNIRLRMELIRDSEAGNQTLSLFYGTETDSINETWKKITTDGATNHFILCSTDNYAQHDVAQNRLTDTPGYPHNWGFCNELNDQNVYAITASTGMEVEFCLQPTNNAQLDTVYFFSIRYNTGLNLDGYQHVPKLTVLDNPLPVELSAFTATALGSQVKLDWITETETDNLGFLLQRKLSGQDTWQEIANYNTDKRLQGQGTVAVQTRYSYLDDPGVQGELYYRLANVHKDGTVEWHQAVAVSLEASLPAAFTLEPAYPNPFNPGTTIKYLLAKDSEVDLAVFDLLGRQVRTLVNDIQQPAGTYQAAWDGYSDNGERLASGIYFVQFKAGGQRFMQRVTLVR